MSATPFHDPYEFVGIPRVSGLWLSPDGERLVTTVSALSADGKKWVSSIWEIDPDGIREPRRLTRSAPGETAPAFLPDGGLLFTSRRPDPDGDEPSASADDAAALWLLPAHAGEARCVATRPGGVNAIAVARDVGTVAFASPVMPRARTVEEDKELRQARANADVTALLHESFPIRAWDHDLGPAQVRFFAADPPVSAEGRATEPRDLTPEPGRALDDRQFGLTPDGREVVTDWYVSAGGAEARRSEVVALPTGLPTGVDTRMEEVPGEGTAAGAGTGPAGAGGAGTAGTPRVLASDLDHDFTGPAVAPDGRHVVCVRTRRSRYDEPADVTLWLAAFDGAGGRDLTPELDLWPGGPVWSPDSAYVYFTADQEGRRPAFRVEVASGEVVRLAGDHGAYSALCPGPDGRTLHALRSAVDEPPTPVRLDARQPGQPSPDRLPAPGAPLDLPGALTETTAAADDGQELRAWLVLPEETDDDGPAPLLLWIHGGPLASWNDWHWRWNPWVAAAHGYAVLLPDPALSTGYGLDFIRRGWGAWGGGPYTDLLALTDAAVKRDEIDEERTAAMGGSFGGYMANWVAGHTDRFRAIVTHASLWALDQMKATTDMAPYARREFGDPEDAERERFTANTPHRHIGNIRTPMLVIHGDRDYRVPIGEALRLWWDLTRYEVEAKFLYFPDENHWVLKPAEAALWYQTVLAFLDHHVLGEPWQRPALL